MMLLDSYLVLWVSSFVTCLTCRNSVYQSFSLTSHDSSDSSQGLLVHAASSPLMDLTGKSLREVFPSPHTWLLMQSFAFLHPGPSWACLKMGINMNQLRNGQNVVEWRATRCRSDSLVKPGEMIIQTGS